MLYLYFQESKSENSQDNGVVSLESILGSTELADALSSADRYFPIRNSVENCYTIASKPSLASSRVKDGNASEECKPLINGKNDIERSENFSEHQENKIEECLDHPSYREPLTWNTEDLDAPKSEFDMGFFTTLST